MARRLPRPVAMALAAVLLVLGAESIADGAAVVATWVGHNVLGPFAAWLMLLLP